MKITKIAESCSNESGSYCDGNYGGPTGHLDSQVFPCKKDPSVETRKKRRKKKAFNLKNYRLAEIITGPDMESLTPTKLEEIGEKLKLKYPNVVWTLDKIKGWVNKNFGGELKPMTPPQDLARRPLD